MASHHITVEQAFSLLGLEQVNIISMICLETAADALVALLTERLAR